MYRPHSLVIIAFLWWLDWSVTVYSFYCPVFLGNLGRMGTSFLLTCSTCKGHHDRRNIFSRHHSHSSLEQHFNDIHINVWSNYIVLATSLLHHTVSISICISNTFLADYQFQSYIEHGILHIGYVIRLLIYYFPSMAWHSSLALLLNA